MKRIVGTVVALTFILVCLSVASAQVGPWMMGPGTFGPGTMGPGMMGGYGGGWYCPYCGQGVGPRGGYGMGPWMMPGYGFPGQFPAGALQEKDAKSIVANYLSALGNPNLKMGKVKEIEGAFEIEIVTKDDSLVYKLVIDKTTGLMRQVY